MDPLQIATRVASEPERGAGGDGERRVACWLRDQLRAGGRRAALETVWVRPDWQLTHLLHCAIAVTGSLLSVSEPGAGLTLLGATLISLTGDLTARFELLRRLTPRRATQNVVSPPAVERAGGVRLIVVAGTDAGRTGAAYGSWAALESRLRRMLRGHMPSPLGALAAANLVLCGVAIARLGGAGGSPIGLVQFVPTVLLVVGFAALVDIALSDVSPGANVHASAAAVALTLVDALDRMPLRQLEVELVLTGASEGPGRGAAAYVRSRRRVRRPEGVAVLAIEPCGAGTPRWLTRDGQLVPLRYHPGLATLCAGAARTEPALGARPYASHGAAASLPARVAGWPAIAIGCRDEHDAVPRARCADDVPEHLDRQAMQSALALCLELVSRLDDDLAARKAGRPPGVG